MLRLDWKNHIPDPEGRLNGKDLENLQNIILHKDEMNEGQLALLKGKCNNFIESLKSGSEYVQALRICGSVLNLKNTSIEFSDEVALVHGFLLTALEKDYPDSDIKSKLSKITSDDFHNLVEYLYPSRNANVDRENAIKSMHTLDISNEENLLEIDKIDTLSTPEIIMMLKAQNLRNHKPELHTALIKKAKTIIESLNPKNRKDFKTAIEFSKALDEELDKELRFKFFSEAFHQAKDLGLFKGIVKALFSFFRISIPYWIEVDRAFLYETLKDVPSLHLPVPENPPESFWTWVNTLTNLKTIDLPKSCTIEQFHKLPLSIEGIIMNKCIHLDDTILDHLLKMALKRIILTAPPDTEYSGSIVDNFTKAGLQRIKNKAEIL